MWGFSGLERYGAKAALRLGGEGRSRLRSIDVFLLLYIVLCTLLGLSGDSQYRRNRLVPLRVVPVEASLAIPYHATERPPICTHQPMTFIPQFCTCRHTPSDITSPSQHILIPLQIKRLLILQPPPIILDGSDLLAVVIRDRVLGTRLRWVGSIPFDAREEAFLLLHQPSVFRTAVYSPHQHERRREETHLSNPPPPSLPSSPNPKNPIPKTRPTKPSPARNSQSRQPQHNYRVETRDLRRPAIDVLLGDYGGEDADGDCGCGEGGGEVEQAAFAAEGEEAVPG